MQSVALYLATDPTELTLDVHQDIMDIEVMIHPGLYPSNPMHVPRRHRRSRNSDGIE